MIFHRFFRYPLVVLSGELKSNYRVLVLPNRHHRYPEKGFSKKLMRSHWSAAMGSDPVLI